MSDRPRRLLFVCVENSCRSQMAEGFARALAHATRIGEVGGSGRPDAEVYSAGSRPSGIVNARAIRFMAERGIDLAAQASKGLDDLPPGIVWDDLVTMGCGDACPHLPALRRADWDLPDPKHLEDDAFRAVRDRIEALVRDLLAAAPPRS